MSDLTTRLSELVARKEVMTISALDGTLGALVVADILLIKPFDYPIENAESCRSYTHRIKVNRKVGNGGD